jgi:antiviral helicase SKI2
LKQLRIHRVRLEQDIESIQQHQHYLEPSVQFLYEMGFITCPYSMELTHDSLTLKGVLATEVNEGHALLMTELYVQETLHHLTGNELVAVLSSFQEKKETEDSPSLEELHVSLAVRDAIVSLNKMSADYQIREAYGGTDGYWKLSTQLVEPMLRWMEGEHASIICAEYGIFEGNFIRSVMKMANMMDEWLSMATYCQHVEQVEKITEVRTRIVRDIVISDSLYLRL